MAKKKPTRRKKSKSFLKPEDREFLLELLHSFVITVIILTALHLATK